MTQENRIKAQLGGPRSLIGAWLNLTSAVTAEIAGQAGYDWCLIDAEHGANTIETVRAQLMALAAASCPAAVRVADNQPWMLKQVLDAGARTVVVPMVSTVAEAEAAVAAMLYPPKGQRGLAAGVIRASGYGADATYMSSANAETCVILQAETQAAVDTIEAVAAVDGVDCVFVGPSDLAANMGHIGDPGAAAVQEAIAHVMAATRSAGKAVGMFCLNPAELARYREMGADFIAVASDVALFRSALSARAEEARAALDG